MLLISLKRFDQTWSNVARFSGPCVKWDSGGIVQSKWHANKVPQKHLCKLNGGNNSNDDDSSVSTVNSACSMARFVVS